MSPEQFVSITTSLPDFLCLIDASGQVLAVNPAASHLFGGGPQTLTKKSLFELAADSEDKIKNVLRTWSRSREATPGPLMIRTANKQITPCNCHGGLIQPKGENTPALILLRIEHRKQFTKSFISLNKKIALLQGEIKERQRTEGTLAQRNAEFEAMFNSIPDALVLTDTERRLVMSNPAVHTMFGYTNEELIGHTTEIFYANKDDYLTQGERRYHSDVNTKSGAYEIKYTRKDGTSFWSETLGTQVRNSDDETIGYIGLIRDITERCKISQELEQYRNHLEIMVSERTTALASANKELEAFSYSVSHDLLAPLRAIDGFSQALLEDYVEQIDETGKDYLQRVRNGAQNMGALINDLLSLSKVTQGELKRQTIDLSALAHININELREYEPQREVDINITPGIEGWADKHLMKIVLTNLFGNAWKYTKGKTKAQIAFDATKKDGKTTYHVRDNGAGFNMEYADKLFVAFQRLHKADDFEGTGIGLATVARILHRHGGQIWAEAEVGQGAVFHFTLGVEKLDHAAY